MANTKITSNVIADNAVGISALNVSDGSDGQVLTTNGAGTLSFADAAGGVDGIVSSATSTAITITSVGAVGINATSPDRRLHVVSSAVKQAKFEASGSGESGIEIANSDGIGELAMGGEEHLFLSNKTEGKDLYFKTTPSGGSATEAMRIDSDGKIGIATDSPNALLDVEGTASVGGSGAGAIFNSTITPTNNNTASIVAVTGTMNAAPSLNANSKISGLRINPTFPSSMNGSAHCAGIKIDSFNGQSATIGTGIYAEATTGSDTNYAGYLADTDTAVGSANKILGLAFTQDNSAANAYYVYMTDGNSVTGSIQGGSGNSVNFNTTSDRRLKENIVDATSQLETINNIQVREFDWKYSGHHQVGVIAQELETIVPDAVNVGGEDENKHPYGVDYGKLTPYLVKAMQEQQTIIDDLKSRIETLEG